VQGGWDEAKRILTEKLEELHTLAKALLEYETLTGDEIKQLLDSGKIDRPDLPSSPLPATVRGAAVPKAGKRYPAGAKPQEA
jgi:cell division protease FtsH